MIMYNPDSMFISVYHLIISALILSACGNVPENKIQEHDNKSLEAIGYDLPNPDETFILPSVLHEISGLALYDSATVACVQDEVGMIFFYDLIKRSVTDNVTFYENGDYEDIAIADGIFYVIRSNGSLFKIRDLKKPFPPIEFKLKDIPHRNIEGLCYDRLNNRLIIAPKDKADKDSKASVKQGLYVFNLIKGELSKEPLFGFEPSVIKDFAAANNVSGPAEYKKKGEPKKTGIQFDPSAIAVHPVTGKLFLLSADDHMLFVFSMQGDMEYMTYLKPEVFNMAEGITFFNNGDMLISNEGQTGNATILRFRYRK